MALLGFAHIQITVKDLARSVCFYRDALGMTERFPMRETVAFLRTPGGHDTLTLNAGGEPGVGTTGGIAHFGFVFRDVASVDDAVAAVAKIGCRLLERGPRGNGAYAFVEDPDGYSVELYAD